MISDDGTVLPPMVNLSGVLHQRQWYTSKGGRHTLQGQGQGGMLYLEEACDMVMDREQVEVNKAAAALKRAQKAADKVVKAP